MTKMKAEKVGIENAEYGVDSRYTSKKDRENDSQALMEARLRRMKNVSDDQILRAKLVQLKLKMAEYVENPGYRHHHFFAECLTTYIDSIYSRRSNFAKDIDITPIRLSQVLNSHREPGDEFMMRLMVHSEKTYRNVCEFRKNTWYQVYYQEKICDTMHSQDKWRPEVEKHVNVSKLIRAE